jgi:ankyrin repeat protein
MQSTEEQLFASATRGNIDDLDYILSSIPSESSNLLYSRRPSDGWSILHIAAYYGQVNYMRHLIEKYKYDPNLPKTNMGGIAIHKAAVGGQLKACEYLVSAGSEPDSTNERNWTPFLECAIHGHLECAKFLLSKGARINIQDTYGKSSLHYAAQNGNLDYVDYLMKNGADRTLKTKSGETPEDYAKTKAASNPSFEAVCKRLQSN